MHAIGTACEWLYEVENLNLPCGSTHLYTYSGESGKGDV